VTFLVFGVSHLREQGRLSRERTWQEYREREFARVKQGESRAWVMDSRLLPMLANDDECKRVVTHLDFASTDIDASDAASVSKLVNVTSMTFYCTRGTRDLLLAARSLPITDLYIKMGDRSPDSYLILKEFPQLKRIRIEHVVEDDWLAQLQSELPGVVVDAPYPKSKESATQDQFASEAMH
jgi:hypothetical protein